MLWLLGLVVSFGLGIAYNDMSASAGTAQYSEVRENSTEFKFTNPLLECNIGQEYLGAQVKPSEKKINDMISDETSNGDISSAAVYYRDLNNGPYININGGTQFLPASLMKVPLMMYFYKEGEDEPSLLSSKVVVADKIPKGISFVQHFEPEQTIDITKTYTIDQLIDSMITYSDNYATEALDYTASTTELDDLLGDLHIEISDPNNDLITVKDYSTFFRVLFNSSYLNQDDSEKALKLLSDTTFDVGIKKDLPASIVVAHKFGERQPDASGMSQVHDCGIVYFPLHPYLICVMTTGKDPDRMADSIAKISKLVYDEVDSQK